MHTTAESAIISTMHRMMTCQAREEVTTKRQREGKRDIG